MLEQSVPAAEVRALLERERTAYAVGGFGARSPWGARPALVVIDVTYGFVGHGNDDDAERYPNWCGPDVGDAVARNGDLLVAARAAGIPVIFTTGSFSGIGTSSRRIGQKHPRAAQQPPDSYSIVTDLAPAPGEPVLAKQAPSAFSGTPLTSLLMAAGVDTLIMTGCSTSGCVRSTAVDAFSLGLAGVVVEDATFDRSSVGHEVTLFELGMKYSDVVVSAEVLSYLGSLDPEPGRG